MINCFDDGAAYEIFSVRTVHQGRHWTFYQTSL